MLQHCSKKARCSRKRRRCHNKKEESFPYFLDFAFLAVLKTSVFDVSFDTLYILEKAKNVPMVLA